METGCRDNEQLTNRENASLNSDTCSSVRESACLLIVAISSRSRMGFVDAQRWAAAPQPRGSQHTTGSRAVGQKTRKDKGKTYHGEG